MELLEQASQETATSVPFSETESTVRANLYVCLSTCTQKSHKVWASCETEPPSRLLPLTGTP